MANAMKASFDILAQQWIDLLWRDIEARMRALVHRHHLEHEPGGKDQIQIPLRFLADVSAVTPAAGDTLAYDQVNKLWQAGPATTAASITVKELDGTPSVSNVTEIMVSNGKLADNGAGSITLTIGGGGKHQVHFSLPLPAGVIPPGPTNITGSDLTITALRFASDGAIQGSMTPGCSFSFGAGGGSSLTSQLSAAWPNGTTLTFALTTQGEDGTYLAIDAAVEEA